MQSTEWRSASVELAANKVALTVLIAVRNEEKNIAECVRSVSWADQICVLDSQSTDKTIEIAVDEGADVYQFYYDNGWPKKRNWGLKNLPIRNEWVLILDADERVTSELRDSITNAIQQERYDGFYIRWKFIFLRRWMKHSWSHGWMLRLFRHGKGEYEDLGMRHEGGWDAEVHENVFVDGACARLNGCLLHESREDLAFWVQKQNEFSTWNAARRIQQLSKPMPPLKFLFSHDPGKQRKWLKALFTRLPCRPLLMFLWLYVVRLGFLDGMAGFYFCRMRAMHELVINAKLFEQRQEPHKSSETSHERSPVIIAAAVTTQREIVNDAEVSR